MFIEEEEIIELTQKEKDLAAIDARISGLKSTITTFNAVMAERAAVKAKGTRFILKHEPKAVDEASINLEIVRLEAARKDVMKRKN